MKGKASPSRFWKVIGAIIIIIIISVGFYWLLSLFRVDPIRIINSWSVHDEESCEKDGGHWSIGVGDIGRCIYDTNDGGKVCTDSSQCQGMCLADSENAKEGKCTEHNLTLGCLNKVENGKVQGTICLD